MRLLIAVLAVALALPALLVAIALGPVVVGILCAAGFGLVVFAIVSLLLGLGKEAARLARH